jgi:putrescine transport system substrate-binding protein
LTFSIPKEGSLNDADILAIPAGAPHPRNAHLFIDYLLRPDIAARNTNLFGYANGVPSSVPLLNDAVQNDPVIYPPPEVRARLMPARAKSLQYTRLLMRTWTRFKTGT